MLNNKQYICRICGLVQEDLPWGEDGKSPSFDICQCCGVEFGYEDSTLKSIRKFREEWIKNGCLWFDKKCKPTDWQYEIQSQNIPSEWI